MSKITKSNFSGLPHQDAANAPGVVRFAAGTSSATSPAADHGGNLDKFASVETGLSSRTVFSNAKGPAVNSSNLLPGLELIRGLACLQVLCSHIFVILMLHSRAKMNPSFWKLAVLDWSYQSVMVFFVLSGYVIALSQQRKQQDFFAFMRSRFRRLEPLYLVALALSFAFEAYFYPPPAYDMLVGHLIYVQGSDLSPVFNTNSPLWSLGYEFFFYLAFAFTIGRHQKRLHVVWFCLGLGAIGLNLAGLTAPGVLAYFQNILSLSPVWLLGVFIIDRPFFTRASLVQKFMLFGMFPLAAHSVPFLGSSNSPAHSLVVGLLIAPLLYAAARLEPDPTPARPLVWFGLFGLYLAFAGSFLASNEGMHHHTEMIFGMLCPLLFLCLAPGYRLLFGETPFFSPRITTVSLFLGKMSYAIYIIHFPLLIALGTIMLNPVLQVAADILLVIPFAWFLTYYLEPLLGSLFDHIWPAARKTGLRPHPVIS